MPTTRDRALLGELTVLYAEDDREAREQTAQFLSRRVGRLLVAEDGAEALSIFDAERPDIVVTDIRMPHLDGLGLAAALRERAPGLPVILITAFEEAGYLMRSISLGVARYVTKPVDGTVLDEALVHAARLLRAERERELRLQQERELEAARHDAALGMLAGGMAHDYNNLVQGLMGAIWLAEHAPPGADLREFFADARASFEQARELAGRLELLQPGHGGELLPTPIEPLLRREVDTVANATRGRVRYSIPHDLAPVPVETPRIAKVFQVLAANAMEADAPNGILEVSARTQRVDTQAPELRVEPGSYLRIDFKDQGPGIAPEDLGGIFDPYTTTKERGAERGRGLSLAVAHAVMRMHRGAISVASTLGQGSTFTVWLPTARAIEGQLVPL